MMTDSCFCLFYRCNYFILILDQYEMLEIQLLNYHKYLFIKLALRVKKLCSVQVTDNKKEKLMATPKCLSYHENCIAASTVLVKNIIISREQRVFNSIELKQ